ncbi:hypothetical protein TWF696_007930 [Orbilia brochopaga]|uniref:F-box domain-containing protein n=1 Tax=Orbilia brochopaga TaxID=3140254 RepID=A0AAV9UMQ5_9PEZI
MTDRLTTLPTELLRKICLNIKNTNDLTAVARVCQRLNDVATPILYRTVTIKLHTGRGIHYQLLASFLIGETEHLRYTRCLVVTGSVFGMPPHDPRDHVIATDTVLHLILIIRRLEPDTLKKIIWDADIYLQTSLQELLYSEQRSITSFILSPRPRMQMMPMDTLPLAILFQQFQLKELQMTGIRRVSELRSVIFALVVHAATLETIVLDFTDELVMAMRNSQAGAAWYTILMGLQWSTHTSVERLNTYQGTVVFPRLTHVEITGLPDWTWFLDGSQGNLGERRLPIAFNGSTIDHLRITDQRSYIPLVRSLTANAVRPQRLHLLLTACEPELATYLRQSSGLVELRIELIARSIRDRKETDLSSHDATLKRLFWVVRNPRGRLLNISSLQFNKWVAMSHMEEIAAVIDLDHYCCKNGQDMKSIKSIWLLGVNEVFEKSQLAATSSYWTGRQAERLQMLETLCKHFYRRGTKPPPSLEVLSVGITHDREPFFIGELADRRDLARPGFTINSRISAHELSIDEFNRRHDNLSMFSMLKPSWQEDVRSI